MTPLRQRLLLVAGWILAAVGAGVVASGAVAVAGGQVLDRPLQPMTAAEVAALPVVEVEAPDAIEPHASGGFGPVTGDSTSGSEGAEGPEGPSGTGGSTADPDDAIDPVTLSAGTAVRVAANEGGRASFADADGTLLLLWATPRPGHVATTRAASPEAITLAFSSNLGVWVIEATLIDGAIGIVSRPEPIT